MTVDAIAEALGKTARGDRVQVWQLPRKREDDAGAAGVTPIELIEKEKVLA